MQSCSKMNSNQMFLNQICKSRFTTEPKNNNINKNIRHISLLQCHIEICDYLLHTFLEINLEKHIAASWGSASCNSYVNLELKHLGKVHHHNVKKVREYFESISIKNFYIIDMAEQFTTKFATVNKVNMSPITFIQNMQHYTKRGINFCKVIHEQSINYLAKLPILTEHQRLCIRYQRAMLEALQTTTSLILMQNNLKTMGETNEVSNSNTKKYQTETSNMRGGNPKVQINNVNIQFTSNNNIYLNQSNVQLINNNKHKSITNSNNSQLMIAKTQIPSVKFQSTSTTRAKPTNNSIVYNDLCKNPLLLCNNTTTTTYSAAEVKRNHKTTNNKQIDVYQQILCQAKNTNATITHTPPVRHSNLINNVGTAKFQNPNILNSQNDIPTTVNDLFTESDEYSIEKFLSDINNLQSAYLNQTNVIDMQNRTNGNHSILELNPTRNDEHPIRIEANLNRIEVNPNRIEGNLNRIEVNPDSIEINPNRIEGNPNRIEGNLNRIEINTNGIEENFNRIQRSSSRNEVTPNSIEINPNRILLNPVRNEVNLIENENRFENVNEIGIEISTSSIEVNQDRIEEKQSGNEEKLNGNEEKELGNEKSVSRDEETSTKQDASKETIKVKGTNESIITEPVSRKRKISDSSLEDYDYYDVETPKLCIVEDPSSPSDVTVRLEDYNNNNNNKKNNGKQAEEEVVLSKIQKQMTTDCDLTEIIEKNVDSEIEREENSVSPNLSLLDNYNCFCGKKADAMCICKKVCYCSQKCQSDDWEKHELICTYKCDAN